MLRIKKLDIFIAKQFGLLFMGTFFICQFVLMMQFLWRYIDELIGKGLTMDVMAQFLRYMGLMLVPQALPLAILLSSLMTFGNLGEFGAYCHQGCRHFTDAGFPLTHRHHRHHHVWFILFSEQCGT